MLVFAVKSARFSWDIDGVFLRNKKFTWHLNCNYRWMWQVFRQRRGKVLDTLFYQRISQKNCGLKSITEEA